MAETENDYNLFAIEAGTTPDDGARIRETFTDYALYKARREALCATLPFVAGYGRSRRSGAWLQFYVQWTRPNELAGRAPDWILEAEE